MDYINAIINNTPEFVNHEIKKPTIDDDNIQRFKTNNLLCWIDEIMSVNQCLDDDFCNARESLEQKNLQGVHTKKIFQKKNWLEKNENRISIGLKGTYVYYNDEILNKKKDDILKEIHESEDIKVYEKYLAECFVRKANKYRNQHEYRLIFSEFKEANTKKNFIFPDGIELECPLSKKVCAKEVKNNEVGNLRLEDFEK